MVLITNKYKISNNIQEFYWETKFYVESAETMFKYCYFYKEKLKKKVFWDRESIRKLDLVKLFMNETEDLNQRFICLKKNSMKIFDYDFNQTFKFDQIDKSIFAGNIIKILNYMNLNFFFSKNYIILSYKN